MCAVTYLVQSITNFVPNIKKLVNYCLFFASVHDKKTCHVQRFCGDIMIVFSRSFIEFSNHQDCREISF